MSTRRGRVRHSVRNRQGGSLTRHRSWEDPERMMESEPPGRQAAIKNCCRSLATFMCTQVGVGGIIVGYAIVGAFGFIALETQHPSVTDTVLQNITRSRDQTAQKLLNDWQMNQFNESEWDQASNKTLHAFQKEVVDAVKKGYDGRNVKEQWNFPAALMFTLSIFTMIGYGNLVPRTEWGKVITIFYAVFGIPLYILYFMNMGRALAQTFKWIYIKLNSCNVVKTPGSSAEDLGHTSSASFRNRVVEDEEDETVIVPSSASLYVLMSYICVGTIMFAEWEGWDYLDSAYFCVTSLCKIGLGDFVPGTNIDDSEEGNQTKLVINFIYLLLGLGLVAMCYNLLREEVLAKLKQLKSDVKDLCHFIRNDCSCADCDDGSMESVTMQVEQNGREENGCANTVVEGSVEYSNNPRRFIHVDGYDGRKNDIVYCQPLTNSDKSVYEINGDSDTQTGGSTHRTKVVVFFGGDIQDFTEMMEMHRDHRQYSNWNLETTARLLQRQFPAHHIVVVRPSRIQMLTFSCYDNFVHCNNTGVPDHVINYYALLHLETLLKNLSERIETEGDQIAKDKEAVTKSDDEDSIVSSTTHEDHTVSNGVDAKSKLSNSHPAPVNPHFDRAAITLVGFSKGCVVLNQLIYEFHYMKTLTPDDLTMDVFLKCIKDMYWLDGGHNGGKNTWITSRSLLETLTRLGIRVHVHMTPYQLTDERRPWIRREEKIFSDFLKRFDAPISRHVHFENEIASLDLHLQLVAQFASPDTTTQEENPNQTPHTSALNI